MRKLPHIGAEHAVYSERGPDGESFQVELERQLRSEMDVKRHVCYEVSVKVEGKLASVLQWMEESFGSFVRPEPAVRLGLLEPSQRRS